MSDPRPPRDQPAGDGELVSAYLDGDLDAGEAAAFEARLEADPGLAVQLERTRQVVEALAGLRATPPEGYAERLHARLAAERDTVSLDAARATRAQRAGARHVRASRRGWTPLGAVAGVLLVALLGGVTVLGSLRGAGDEMATEDAGGLSATSDGDDRAELFAADPQEDMDVEDDEVAVEEHAEPFDDTDVDDTNERVEDDPAPVVAGGQPELVEAGAVLDGEEAAREHFRRPIAAAGVVGIDLLAAEDVALAYRVSIQRAEPFESGLEAGLCLEDAVGGSDVPTVPVAVESLVYQDRPALAYLVVTASAGAERLDRVEARVISPEGCLTRLYLDVTPER